MKAILIMFSSLNRHMLEPYGCTWTHTPNFTRLSKHAIRYEQCYAGSLPAIPCRRELHTGRINFLHRSWGPMEPYDNSVPRILKENGVHSCLISDHLHYWEEGGANYHTKYSSWEFVRGQEGDPYFGLLKAPDIPKCVVEKPGETWRQDWVNRSQQRREEDMPIYQTFQKGLEFISRNREQDNWFLHLDIFDPHEPFYTQEKYKKLYPHEYHGDHFDWIPYREVQETPEEINHIRMEYAAAVSMCDNYLGKLLDAMDQYLLWDDTMLIVTSDNGLLLGEHGWWGKCTAPFYNEVVNIPLFLHVPGMRENAESYRLVQNVDLAPTLLEYFCLPVPPDMTGQSLLNENSHREGVLFGTFGGQLNCSNGRYVLMLAPEEKSERLFNYTLMPSHMKASFTAEELSQAKLIPGLGFTQGIPVLKIPGEAKLSLRPDGSKAHEQYKTMLFDLRQDPKQDRSIKDEKVEVYMKSLMKKLLKENDSPPEIYRRFGLERTERAGK